MGFIFQSSGCRSPFGSSYVSGSHCGNKAYWSVNGGGGYSSRTTINIRQYNYGGGCCDGGIFGQPYMGGYYGGGCCGSGLSEGAAWTAFGVGAGIGLLASPLGGPILKGIGTGFKYIGKGIAWGATKLWQGTKWLAKETANLASNVWKGLGNWFHGRKWGENNEWNKYNK